METVNILGTNYTILRRALLDDPMLETCDGYCDWTTKTLVVEEEMSGSLGDMNEYVKKVLRHEIVHAFLFESGLGESSHSTETWGRDEEIVDWISRQGLKIYQAWKEVGAI